MASEDTISSSRKSAAGVRGESRMPTRHRGGNYPGKAAAAWATEPVRCPPQDHSSQNQPTACAAATIFPKHPRHANISKLYSELSTSRFTASFDFHSDSMTTGPKAYHLNGAPGRT